VDRLSELLGQDVQFSYTALDRIVLNGYIERLQRPENLVYFFHDVVGIQCIEPTVLMSRTDRYRDWVRQYTADRGIPVLQAPKGERKEDLVLPHYARLTESETASEGVACVLTSMEQGRTFVSYTPRFAPKSGDATYRLIKACRKQFLHYYFYVLDPVMGPMSLRVATYLPFDVTCYLNGHSFMAQELTRQQIAFAKDDNAFLATADLPALQAAADRLGPELLRERCDYWTSRLAPGFTARERRAIAPAYRYSIGQIELATDVIFHDSARLTERFRRAVDIGLLLGGAERTTHLFGRRINRRYKGKLETALDRREEGHPVLRSYYQTSFVKQYEKADRLLRTETCINNTYHLDIGRRLENLPALVERMAGTNRRYLDLQAELLASTVDTGQFAALAQPTVLGKRRIPGIKLHDDRVIRLLDTLLHPCGLIADWTSRDLSARVMTRHRLAAGDYRLSQLRYDLTKLRAKGLVERIGKTRRYRVTMLGLKLGIVLVKARSQFLGPLCTLASAAQSHHPTVNPSQVEITLRQLDTDLNTLCQTPEPVNRNETRRGRI
jgi:hypothetical protein